MLGDETCDISHSHIRNKTYKKFVMLGGETCDISHSRETTGSESDTGIWDLVTASLTYNQQFHL